MFGLPPTKKELVEKVKPEMKLFLYDFNLRKIYGIYKTTSAGGMNVEPNAFRSCKRPLPTLTRLCQGHLLDMSPFIKDEIQRLPGPLQTLPIELVEVNTRGINNIK